MSARAASRADLPAALLVLVWSLLVAWSPLRDLDWGWHLATFERWMREGRLPWDDRFAWGSEGAYEPVHCLFQLAIGWLHRGLGLSGLVLFKALLQAAIGLALLGLLRMQRLGPWTAAALTLLVLAGSTSRLLVRPHLFTTLGLVLLLWLLLRARDRDRHPWPLVPLLALWACAHPGVVFGALTVGGFALAEAGWHLLDRARGRSPRVPAARALRLAVWSAVALLATGLNPLSFDLYPYLLAHRDMQGSIEVAELRGLFAHTERGIPVSHLLVAGLWVLGALAALRRPRRLDRTLTPLALCFAVLGVVVAREAPLALIALACALAPTLRPPPRASRRTQTVLLALLLVAPGLALLERARQGFGGGLAPGAYPEGPAEWILRHEPRGRLWNTNYTGGYLVWRLASAPDGPLWQVHTDGRMPMFTRALREARDFPALEARYRPEILVLDWTPGARTFYPFEADPDFRRRWVMVHVSAGGKVFLRREGPNAALAARFAYPALRFLGRTAVGDGEREALLRDLERARAEDPGNPYLPR